MSATQGITKTGLEKVFKEMLDPITGYKHINNMEDLKKWVKISLLPNKRYYVYLSFPNSDNPVKFHSLQEWRNYNANGEMGLMKFTLSQLEKFA